jgi:class 3 adenylate cyclase/predicted ATPase
MPAVAGLLRPICYGRSSRRMIRLANDLRAWLENSGFGKYADTFEDNDIGPDVLAQITESHLEQLGVSLGDRLRLLQAINGEIVRTIQTSAFVVSDGMGARSLASETLAITAASNPERSSDAERRPLTVMFCDLADSTALSTRLDPEDLQDVIRAYQEVSTKRVREYEGYVAKYMGDGILVYFGYPKSLERNAERAVRSALSIVEFMAVLNQTMGREKGIEIAVRIGIATGMVMVGEVVGEGMAQERTVIGEAPNMAARLQSLARRNGIIIGSLTKELSGDAFDYDDMGSHELKGISGLVKAWGVLELRDDTILDADEDEADGAASLQPLIGRDEEIGLLRRAWQSTKEEGRGQIVTISGEAGIGKSGLIDGLRAEIRTEGMPAITFRGSLYHSSSALYPVIEYLKRLASWQPEDGGETRLDKLEAALKALDQPLDETVPLLASLLSLELPKDRYPPLTLTPQQQRRQTHDAIIAMALETAERQPFLQLWEDLHWADPSTLELLGHLIEQAPTVSILMVLTARPEFVPSWPVRSHITPITLNRLERPHAEALIARVVGLKPLPEDVVDHIVTKTDGVPLYVEELTKTILASDILIDTGERFELAGTLSSLAIPDTLQESLMARLDSLPQVRELAQLGSVLGREFAYEMISGLSTVAEGVLQEGLGQLVDAELLYQRGRPPRARYVFKHALIQDAAYQSLLRRTRQQSHRLVAELLEFRFPEIVETQPELVAHHYAEAGLEEQAISYCHRAGQRASARSAHQEALSHFTMGLTLLQSLPETQARHQQELRLQTALGASAIITRGHGAQEVEAAYSRARQLCQQLGDNEDVFPVLFGLWRLYVARPDLALTQQLAEELQGLAERSGVEQLQVVGHYAAGAAYIWAGELGSARRNLEEVEARYAPEQRSHPIFQVGQDPGIACRAYAGKTLWLMGYPEQSLAKMEGSLMLARELDHHFSLAFALCIASMGLQFRGDGQGVLERADTGVNLSTEHGFPHWLAFSKIMRGWAVADLGQTEEGLRQMGEGLSEWRGTGAELFVPYYLSLKAEAYSDLDQIDEGLDALGEALEATQRTGEVWWNAELHRRTGALLLRKTSPDVPRAESCFQEALLVARRQQAKSFELRAAIDLAQLWRDQGKPINAGDLLESVYNWFTEGFDTADLKYAKALFDEFS